VRFEGGFKGHGFAGGDGGVVGEPVGGGGAERGGKSHGEVDWFYGDAVPV